MSEVEAAAERLYYAYDQLWNKEVVRWGDERVNRKKWLDMALVALGGGSMLRSVREKAAQATDWQSVAETRAQVIRELRDEREEIAAAIILLVPTSGGGNPFGDVYARGFDAARRLAFRIAMRKPV